MSNREEEGSNMYIIVVLAVIVIIFISNIFSEKASDERTTLIRESKIEGERMHIECDNMSMNEMVSCVNDQVSYQE